MVAGARLLGRSILVITSADGFSWVAPCHCIPPLRGDWARFADCAILHWDCLVKIWFCIRKIERRVVIAVVMRAQSAVPACKQKERRARARAAAMPCQGYYRSRLHVVHVRTELGGPAKLANRNVPNNSRPATALLAYIDRLDHDIRRRG